MSVPNLEAAILEVGEILERQGLKESYEVIKTTIKDDQAPIIHQGDCKVKKHFKQIEKVTLDGGARVNVMSKKIQKMLDLKVREAPLKLRMADQNVFKPLGMVDQVPIQVWGVKFETAFMVLDVGEAYEMLVGRPRLRAVRAVHDLGTKELTMQLKSKNMSIDIAPTTILVAYRPGQLYIAEPAQVLTKLKTIGIVSIGMLDLN